MRVYGGRMRLLLAVLAASTLIGGCACTEANLIGLPVENDAPAAASPTTVVDTRIPGGWYQRPGIDPSAQCTSPIAHGLSIPCEHVLSVCAWNEDSGWTHVMLPAIFTCTDQSPTLADVCTTRPAGEWPYYGLDANRCAAITSR